MSLIAFEVIEPIGWRAILMLRIAKSRTYLIIRTYYTYPDPMPFVLKLPGCSNSISVLAILSVLATHLDSFRLLPSLYQLHCLSSTASPQEPIDCIKRAEGFIELCDRFSINYQSNRRGRRSAGTCKHFGESQNLI